MGGSADVGAEGGMCEPLMRLKVISHARDIDPPRRLKTSKVLSERSEAESAPQARQSGGE